MGEATRGRLALRKSHASQGSLCDFFRVLCGPVLAEHLGHRIPDPHRWVQRRARILGYVGDHASTKSAHISLIVRPDHVPADNDLPGGDPCATLRVSQQRQRGRRLARSRLADQSEDLARSQGQGHVFHDGIAVGRLDHQPLELESRWVLRLGRARSRLHQDRLSSTRQLMPARPLRSRSCYRGPPTSSSHHGLAVSSHPRT